MSLRTFFKFAVASAAGAVCGHYTTSKMSEHERFHASLSEQIGTRFYSTKREDNLLEYLTITNKRMEIIETKLNDMQQVLGSSKATQGLSQQVKPDEGVSTGQEQRFVDSQELERRRAYRKKNYSTAQASDEFWRHTPLLKPRDARWEREEQAFVDNLEHDRRREQWGKKYGE